ncbi:MAG: efflux RND transporter periplasmic adaptor subunit [Candidatus Aminicenantes bacterium]|nr:efflux RND transporter periplasmic adaptor subunit [Candidatus Aminicenantes bacterium]
MNKRLLQSAMILSALAALLAVSCSKGGETAGPGAKRGGGFDRSKIAFPVDVEQVKLKSLVYSVNAVGSVDAFETVQVTARVSGVVDRVLFSEGSPAALGQVLVEIEPERYKLSVEAAQAAQEKAEAAKADAVAGLKRRESVINETPGLIPGEELETWRTKVALANSDVALAKAALNQANLNLHDAYVRAPFYGILQSRTVQTGQYVQTGTVLATLVRRDPLLLRFKAPEREAAQIRIGMKALFKVRDDSRQFAARIVHVAAAADDVTRLVAVTAEVNDNRDRALRPGSFAEISVPVSSERQAPVIPQTSIRASEKGFLAFVVAGGKAEERILTLGLRTADGQVEVLSGITPGEIVVIRGGEALRNGVLVRVSGPQGKPAVAPRPDAK